MADTSNQMDRNGDVQPYPIYRFGSSSSLKQPIKGGVVIPLDNFPKVPQFFRRTSLGVPQLPPHLQVEQPPYRWKVNFLQWSIEVVPNVLTFLTSFLFFDMKL